MSVGKLRTEGYLKAFKDHNLKVNENLILKIEDIEHCKDQIEELINRNSIDAILL